MKILMPNYYKKFRCIAEKCQDSCCIGWTIYVDKKSFYKYRKIKGNFGKELNKNITRNRRSQGDSSYGRISLTSKGRCSFLNENNLCTIYTSIGEGSLCNVCKIYPRGIKKFGDRYEREMTISCPEIARLILEDEELISFEIIEEELSTAEEERVNSFAYDKELAGILWDIRILLIEIAQFREIPVWKRMTLIKQVTNRIQDMLVNGEYNEKIIFTLKEYVQSEETIMLLDKLQPVGEQKSELINQILEFRMTLGMGNEKFKFLINEIREFNREYRVSEWSIDLIEEEFNKYFESKEYMLEHYMVYYIYNNFMNALQNKNLDKEISILLINYMLIKYMLMVKWIRSEKQLKLQDVIDIIYSFSRTMEHSTKFKEQFYELVKKCKFDDLKSMIAFTR